MTIVAKNMLKSSIDYLRLRYISVPDIARCRKQIEVSSHAVPLSVAGKKISRAVRGGEFFKVCNFRLQNLFFSTVCSIQHSSSLVRSPSQPSSNNFNVETVR